MHILLIYTGGTIGMVHNQEGTLIPFDFENITTHVPELARLDYQIDVQSFDPLIDSSNMQPDIWIKIASIIGEHYEKYDGFVVLHGSDTMAYTASALSFLLENLSKPVILTGSQLPIGEIRTDAKENLITALEIAAAKDQEGKAIVPEVCIYFDYQLFRGNRASKIHADKFEAFASLNYPILAEAGVQLKFFNERIMPASEAPLIVHTKLSTACASIKMFPGISSDYINAIIQSGTVKIIVLEAFGAGNTSTSSGFLDSLKKACEAGIIIFDISQCAGGTVELGRYETSQPLAEMGVVSGFDISFEAAITKSMFVLANANDHDIRKMLSRDLRGELSNAADYQGF
jgi:L-asparaginase